MSSYSIIGLMSGTSLDGLDIVFCTYIRDNKGDWNYSLHHTKTYEYDTSLKIKLSDAIDYESFKLLQLDKELGRLFSSLIIDFIDHFSIDKKRIDAIASHGHTIFHQPEKGITLQIGCGETIAYLTNIPTINDFRQKDVCAGGNGAPLVPIGDKLLFKASSEAFLNIGGIANICIPDEFTIAYDISPGNLPLNYLAGKLSLEFDANGENAVRGEINADLFDQLNNLKYYQQNAPKSLGKEWLNKEFIPLIESETNVYDALRTVTQHIAYQIGSSLNSHGSSSVFITGGGAKNTFLIEQIEKIFKGEIIIPDDNIINFKEALIFGFLGALYLENEPNCLASVTGAKRDTIGGVYHVPN